MTELRRFSGEWRWILRTALHFSTHSLWLCCFQCYDSQTWFLPKGHHALPRSICLWLSHSWLLPLTRSLMHVCWLYAAMRQHVSMGAYQMWTCQSSCLNATHTFHHAEHKIGLMTRSVKDTTRFLGLSVRIHNPIAFPKDFCFLQPQGDAKS